MIVHPRKLVHLGPIFNDISPPGAMQSPWKTNPSASIQALSEYRRDEGTLRTRMYEVT